MPEEVIIETSHIVGSAVGGGVMGPLGIMGTLLVQKFLAKNNGDGSGNGSGKEIKALGDDIKAMKQELGSKIDRSNDTLKDIHSAMVDQSGFLRGVMSQK
jgi:hypothetical protein